jgi:hypothetical protein
VIARSVVFFCGGVSNVLQRFGKEKIYRFMENRQNSSVTFSGCLHQRK